MTLLEQWNSVAYDQNADRKKLAKFWEDHCNLRQRKVLIPVDEK